MSLPSIPKSWRGCSGFFDRWDRSNIDQTFASRREYRTEIDGKKVQLIF